MYAFCFTQPRLLGMDPHASFASRDELWHLQNEMKSVFTTQADHSDRLVRLERRLDEDTRMKSVWGASSPFPSVLSGTPQQGRRRQIFRDWFSNYLGSDTGYNPAAEAFKSFDQEQNSNLLSSLHIDNEEEPRRGASRANSVRFDETALQGHFGHTSRSSSEFFPVRTGSGLGSLPMVERSSSHKSEGRQSSTGQSAHSTRLNSLALNPRSPALENQVDVGPPPGLFLLGPLPCIIRCWLDENFSNDTLLYAAVCTGSYTSMISTRLAHKYGIIKQRTGQEQSRVTLQVFLPEATVQQTSPRPLNLIPQVPSLSIDFEVFDLPDSINSLQVIIGSDILRSKSAELSFSQDRLVIFDDERNKLAVPLVRPENSSTFQILRTVPTVIPQASTEVRGQGVPSSSLNNSSSGIEARKLKQSASQQEVLPTAAQRAEGQGTGTAPDNNTAKLAIATAPRNGQTVSQGNITDPDSPVPKRYDDTQSNQSSNGAGSGTPTREAQASTWGLWRRDSNQPPSSDSTFSSVASSSTYQRPGRGKGMKVLKPARSVTSRSISTTPTSSNPDQTSSRWQDAPLRTSGFNAVESQEIKTLDSPRRSFSSDTRVSFSSVGGKARTANPVGGASAFGWLNSGQK